jgi:predicted nucleic acid-binding protein
MSKKGLESAASHGIPLLGLILDSSIIIAAERKRQTLIGVGRAFGEIEIAISAVTLAELVHGIVSTSQGITNAVTVSLNPMDPGIFSKTSDGAGRHWHLMRISNL